jgi:hypothetical protein
VEERNMRKSSVALCASIVLNIVLLVLLTWPGNFAMGEVAGVLGNYAAVSAKGGGSQDALWLANRAAGRLLVFQYKLGGREDAVELVDNRDLRADLELRQLGSLMLVSAAVSDSRSNVYVIDTDADRMVVYSYDRSKRLVTLIQQTDLRAAFTGGSQETETP